jgi:hypothetical protein
MDSYLEPQDTSYLIFIINPVDLLAICSLPFHNILLPPSVSKKYIKDLSKYIFIYTLNCVKIPPNFDKPSTSLIKRTEGQYILKKRIKVLLCFIYTLLTKPRG